MDKIIKKAIFSAVEKEPFAQTLGMKIIDLDDGYSLVEMIYNPDVMDNMFLRAHGGAVFSLIDEAFETVCQTDGTVVVALNVSVTYVSSPKPGTCLRAEAKEISRTKKIANYNIKVTDQDRQLIATCQAMAFRTGKPVPFLLQTPAT